MFIRDIITESRKISDKNIGARLRIRAEEEVIREIYEKWKARGAKEREFVVEGQISDLLDYVGGLYDVDSSVVVSAAIAGRVPVTRLRIANEWDSCYVGNYLIEPDSSHERSTELSIFVSNQLLMFVPKGKATEPTGCSVISGASSHMSSFLQLASSNNKEDLLQLGKAWETYAGRDPSGAFGALSYRIDEAVLKNLTVTRVRI